MTVWLLLIYKLPAEPSAHRVYAWRKFKGLGAVLLQDAVWVLPANARTREQFQWLAAEIIERGGEVYLWEASHSFAHQEAELMARFSSQIEAAYQDILERLSAENPDLAVLSKSYQQVRAQDYFQSEMGEQVRAALLRAGGQQDS
jgi:hypothetical protein